MAQGDVTVVGAGPNGLAAAVALAAEGCRVTVYEAADRIGGGTRTEELTLPGFRHDVCSSVHPMGAGSPFFRTLPLAEHGLEWVQPPVLMAHPFDDGAAALLMRSTGETAATLDAVDARGYAALMDPWVRHWDSFLGDALAPPMRRLPKHPRLMARLGSVGFQSAMGFARRWFEGERARALFVGIAAHSLLSMTMSPGASFGIMLALAGHGAGWPLARGGSQSIADALASLLKLHGGRIVTGAPIRDLGELPEADATLLDLTAWQVLAVAGERLPRRYRKRLEKFRYGPGVFKMDWALSEPIPWQSPDCRRAGTIHLGGSAAEIARSVETSWTGEPDEAPYMLVVQATLFDPSRAPDGKHTAWAYCHVPHGSTVDMSARMERQIERFAPGFHDIVLARSVMGPRELQRHDGNLVGGDINAGVEDVKQYFFRPVAKWDPYATPVRGLYICSASTPPGGAVHGMCGYNAARSALKRMR